MNNKSAVGAKHARQVHHRSAVSVNSDRPNDGNSNPQKLNPQHSGIKLDTAGIATEIRRDYLHEYYVIIAPNRGKRPFDTRIEEHKLIETANSPKLHLEKKVFDLNDEHGSWQVRVVENKFPALTPMNPQAYGMQEIVIDTPLGNRPLSSLSVNQITKVMQVFQERIGVLKNQKAIEYVSVFHNDGYSAGASLAHAHSQIFAIPVMPPKLTIESQTIEQYFTQKNSDPFNDIIAYEQNAAERIIWENDKFIAFCPYASQWPFEAWIMPKTPVTSFTQFSQDDLRTTAEILKKLMGRLCPHLISFNFYLEEGISEHHRFVLKVTGRSIIWGGFEVATGMIINTVPPESAAKWYKA
ncbi:galactose-1-phosphate uridylyltransferase [Candidatus Saccharibacteria bacterium]|nr:galactose-1-phosphate uridylyltransferase [Candidatus Saccharibacteria bacterium]